MSDHGDAWKVGGDGFTLDSSKEQLLYAQHPAPLSPSQSDTSLKSSDTVIHLHAEGTKHDNSKELLTAPLFTHTSTTEFKSSPKVIESVSVEECNKVADSLDILPRRRARLSRCQRFFLHWLTAYRILIASTLLANIAVFAAQIATGPSADAALTATAANLLAAVVVRNEEVVNSSYYLLTKISQSANLLETSIITAVHILVAPSQRLSGTASSPR
jgi:hypothetical protein